MCRLFFRLLRLFLLVVVFAVGYLFFFQQRMIYFPPRATPEEVAQFTENGGRQIDYTTSQGKLTAWLQLSASGHSPERFWIVCGSNASQALDLISIQRNS